MVAMSGAQPAPEVNVDEDIGPRMRDFHFLFSITDESQAARRLWP